MDEYTFHSKLVQAMKFVNSMLDYPLQDYTLRRQFINEMRELCDDLEEQEAEDDEADNFFAELDEILEEEESESEFDIAKKMAEEMLKKPDA